LEKLGVSIFSKVSLISFSFSLDLRNCVILTSSRLLYDPFLEFLGFLDSLSHTKRDFPELVFAVNIFNSPLCILSSSEALSGKTSKESLRDSDDYGFFNK